jgi:hypothetical protein
VRRGIGFARAPGGTNVAPTAVARDTRSLHVDVVPRQAPAQAENFQAVRGFAITVKLRPARTSTVRLHEAAHAIGRLPLNEIVPLPVMVTVKGSRPGAASALFTASSESNAIRAINTRSRSDEVTGRVDTSRRSTTAAGSAASRRTSLAHEAEDDES